MKRLLLSASAVLLSLLCSGRTQAGEAYYLLMFGSQTTPARPNYSHSFATFVRATWPGPDPCPTNPTLEPHTISWLPANKVIRLFAVLPECGHNFELHETIRFVLSTDQRVSMWGPYQIDRDLFERATRQIRRLQSGSVLYKANDTGYRSDHVANCIHAVVTIAEGGRLRIASPGWGETASYAILQRFRPWIINCDQVHPWVGSALGLDCYPIIYATTSIPVAAVSAGLSAGCSVEEETRRRVMGRRSANGSRTGFLARPKEERRPGKAVLHAAISASTIYDRGCDNR